MSEIRTFDELKALNPNRQCACGVLTPFCTNGVPECERCYGMRLNHDPKPHSEGCLTDKGAPWECYAKKCECWCHVTKAETLPSSATSRSGEQEAREWWESIGSPVLNEQHLAAYAAQVRTQERERVEAILDGYANFPIVHEIAAAIREGE